MADNLPNPFVSDYPMSPPKGKTPATKTSEGKLQSFGFFRTLMAIFSSVMPSAQIFSHDPLQDARDFFS